jgi:hypothetical protein
LNVGGDVTISAGGDLRGNTTNATTSSTISGFSTVNDAKTGSYTLTAADNGKVITFASGSNVNCTLPNNLPAGFNCMIVQLDLGTVTFTSSGGSTILNRSGNTRTAGIYAIATVLNIGSNRYITSGDMQ